MPRLLARNDGRKMSRNDGKIVVVARSEASAERRGGERVLSSLRGARHQPSDATISPLCHSD